MFSRVHVGLAMIVLMVIATFGSPCVASDSADGAEVTLADAGDAFYLAQQPQAKPKLTPQPPPAAKPPTAPPAKPATTPAPKAQPAQPPVPTVTDQQPAPSPIRMPEVGMPASRTPMLRLASVPNMLGDFFNQGGQLATTGGNTTGVVDLPTAGGGRRVKVDMTNLAVGLHTEFRGRTTLRVASVFPFQEEFDRPFDAEVHVTLNRYY